MPAECIKDKQRQERISESGVEMSKLENASRSELRHIAEKSKWFHAIDFGDFATSGRFPPGSPQNITLFGAMDLLGSIDLNGCRVLDIGSADGLASFGMKKLGAREVVSIDSFDLAISRPIAWRASY